ncbi:MAG TPA: hypothetical protein VI757_03285 [Bacteroidia bacterium]|nr:hypothetical protein [Bacteroidia bacterium]
MENKNQLPDYTGFGKLKPETISETEELLSADYYFLQSPAHHVEITKATGHCSLRDYVDDRLGGMWSEYPSLKDCVLRHFFCLDCEKDNNFKLFSKAITGLGNIYLQHLPHRLGKDTILTFHPAGRMVVLRLPLPLDNPIIFPDGDIENDIASEASRTRIIDSYRTTVFVRYKNGALIAVPVHMVEYLAPLAFAYEIAKGLVDNGMISKQKILRMIIQDCSEKQNSAIQIFHGTAGDDYIRYSVLFKGMSNDLKQFQEYEEKIVSKVNEII